MNSSASSQVAGSWPPLRRMSGCDSRCDGFIASWWKRPRTQSWLALTGLAVTSGLTMTPRPRREPMLTLQPTLHEVQVVGVQRSVWVADHLVGCSMRAAVGQRSMQEPQKSQLESCTAPPAPNSMRVEKPRPARVIAPVWRSWSQTRTQRVQMMHIWGSNSRNGLAWSGSGCSIS
ncbi:MAG: hypothetical protein V3S20_04690 [Dehalococcoidia bacterium]